MSRVRENRMPGSTGGGWKRNVTNVTAPVPDPTNLGKREGPTGRSGYLRFRRHGHHVDNYRTVEARPAHRPADTGRGATVARGPLVTTSGRRWFGFREVTAGLATT